MFCVCFCFCVFSERHGCVCVGVVVEEGRGEIEEKRRMKGGLGDELYMRVVKYMCVCVCIGTVELLEVALPPQVIICYGLWCANSPYSFPSSPYNVALPHAI